MSLFLMFTVPTALLLVLGLLTPLKVLIVVAVLWPLLGAYAIAEAHDD